MDHVVFSSSALAFLTKVSEKCKYVQPSAVKAKNRWKDNQYWREIRCNKQIWKRWRNCWHTLLRLDLLINNVHTISDNAGRIKESGTSGAKVFVWEDYHSPVWNEPYQKLWMWVSKIFISNEINISYRYVCLLFRNIYMHTHTHTHTHRSVCPLVL